MLKSYILTAVRSLHKKLSFTVLNIAGLAIGITCAAVIFLWVQDELRYDDYFKNKANLYKVKNKQTYGGKTFTFDATPGPFGPSIAADVAGIKNTCRSSWWINTPLWQGERSFTEKGLYVDSTYFSMFPLEFVEGSPSSAFASLNSVVLTEKTAQKLFPNDDALGNQFYIGERQPAIVGGVVKELPENTTFSFSWLAPFDLFYTKNSWLENWGNNGVLTFVETEPRADIASINARLENYVQAIDESYNSRFSLYPMSRWHLYDTFVDGVEKDGKIRFVKLFTVVAWLILLIACINFMNLSTARSEQRAREVGVRKVLGAGRGKLIAQFLTESFLMTLISAILAIGLVYLVLPAFNDLVGKQLMPQFWSRETWIALVAIILLCSLVAGSYPAFYLSSFKPVQVLKGLRMGDGGNNGMVRKILVVFQFSISIILIISTIFIFKQINFARERNLGYDKNRLVTLPVQGDMLKNYTAIKHDLQKGGIMDHVGLSMSSPLNYASNTGDLSWQGKDPQQQVLVTIERVDHTFIPTVGYEVVQGRNFKHHAAEDSNTVIINEAMAKVMNSKEVIGAQITDGQDEIFRVVGVVKDFIFNSVYDSPQPMVFYNTAGEMYAMEYSTMAVRINQNVPVEEAIAHLTAVLKRYNPGYPADYQFVDAQFDKQFKTEMLTGKLASIFSILTIFISCLGLFGLAAYTSERRTREMGIRKVLGASVSRLIALLSKDFLLLVGLACLIAFPIAWWAISAWLNEFDYRIHLSWSVFALSGLMALVIAMLTIGYQAVRTALVNPVKSIHTE